MKIIIGTIIAGLGLGVIIFLLGGEPKQKPVRSECEQIEWEIENSISVFQVGNALKKKEIAILQGKCLD